ncbi:unnamed protein product [Pleuronectes platessa]|uniref:Uncharacterized protein n=1 Tax=Pleuronectes platessa TaxID=8262 RepID=A0A9N7YDY2_PLEPL|nr:unnamed protein product [Pleuronectes platessa]
MTEELEKKGCSVINAPGDADVDIVKAAVKASEHQPTTLIGEDTDLLILLLFYAGTKNRGLYFRSDKSKATKVYNITLANTLLSLFLPPYHPRWDKSSPLQRLLPMILITSQITPIKSKTPL